MLLPGDASAAGAAQRPAAEVQRRNTVSAAAKRSASKCLDSAGEWKRFQDKLGRVFYRNVRTGKSQWERPASLSHATSTVSIQ